MVRKSAQSSPAREVMMDRRERLIARAKQGYRLVYGAEPSRFFASPGRVNLIGEHSAPSGGYVLSCAINRDTVIALGPGDKNETGRLLHAAAIDMGSARCRIDLDGDAAPAGNSWENHVRGVAAMLEQSGHALRPARLAIAGDIPLGAGLASSASLGVAIALGLSDYSNLSLSPHTLAGLAHKAEQEFVGAPSSVADHLTAACASAGKALLIDCSCHEHMPIPIAPGLAIMVIDTGIRRAHGDDVFAARAVQCAAAARHYGAASLRDLTLEQLERGQAGLDDVLFARARHVVKDAALVEPAAVALARGDAATLSEALAASHASLSLDFEVSLPAIDQLVEMIAGALGPAGGVRLTGEGFGGCLVAVVVEEAVETVHEVIAKKYNLSAALPARAEVLHASSGASVVRPAA
jgi:galactokinase